MRGVQAACPACGGPVRFKISSALVTVCEFCRTVVARGDKSVEDLGKVAALVETASPLHLGLKGKYNGKSFLIMGRVQYQHEAGGVWDEWYVAFPNNRWGWLAEAQGRFYLSFEKQLPETVRLPKLDELQPGSRIAVADQMLAVAEVGRATAAGAEGEMPFVLHPGESHHYSDLFGPEKRFVTLDFAEERPTVYVGKEVTLDDLGIGPDVLAPEKDPRQISGIQINCPQCGGPLELRAPDQTQRVICQHCNAMLDAAQGKLAYLETLNVGKKEFVIPLGAVGNLNDVEYTVIGAMQRSVTYEGTDYFWSEYLLYQPRVGFRWLVDSENHWSFVEPVSPGDVEEGGQSASLNGRTFKLFQQATATVRYVIGEFYWKVSLGETAYSRDFISPPQMLSIEHSVVLDTAGAGRKKRKRNDGGPPALPKSEEAGTVAVETGAISATSAEVNYSLGTYVRHEDVEKAFGLSSLPRGWKVAPNQPKPMDNRVFVWWLGFLAALFLFFLIGNLVGPGADVCLGLWAAILVSVLPLCGLFYRHTFEVSRWKDSDYSPYQSGDDE